MANKQCPQLSDQKRKFMNRELTQLDINVQSLKGQVCQIQIQNVQQTAMSTENIHNYQCPPATMQKLQFLHK